MAGMDNRKVPRKPKKITAVIFDIDGTLLNSVELLFSSKQYVAQLYDLPMPSKEDFVAVVRDSGSVQEVMTKLWPGADPKRVAEANRNYVENNGHLVSPYDGLIGLLEALKLQDITLAAVTGASAKVISTMRDAGIDHYFSSIIHSEMVKKFKPDPEGMMLALKECGVKPSQTVAVGDSVGDILSAKAAGISVTVGLTHGFGAREDLENAGADYIVNSLTEVKELISEISR